MKTKHFFKTSLLIILSMSIYTPARCLDQETFLTNYLWQRFIELAPPHRPRIALVLGGGGARGLAHIGVLKVLDEEKLPVDMIIGNSVGALVGSLYAAGVPMDKIEQIGENIGWNDLTNISDPSIIRLLITKRLLSTEKMEKYLQKNIGSVRFEDLKIPFACVATDLKTGERIILRDGDVALAARASSTVPGLFDPVPYRQRFLVDGGLSDNIPTDVARLLGADFIIAVVASADFSKYDVSNVFMVLTQSIYIQGRLLDNERLKLSDFTIIPKVKDVTAVDLSRSKDCIEAGVLAARQKILELKQALIQRTSDEYLFK
ncbi:MAG: patatin-like phospholipase family protein [Elusimicrobiota bacterium]